MHDLVHFVKIGETGDDGQRDLSKNGLRNRSHLLVDVVEGAAQGREDEFVSSSQTSPSLNN
jgi:hypothetical protein